MKIVDQQLANSLLTSFDKQLKSILLNDLNKNKRRTGKKKITDRI